MTFRERDNGHVPNPFEKTRKIIDLVLQVPHDVADSGRVLDAVGCVMLDLKVLESHQAMMKQLGRGVSTQDIDNAQEQIMQAAALRPVNEAATEERLIVLAGLHRIRQATEFNERVARRAENGTDGVTIFQAGISSRFVEQAIIHVNEATRLVEEAPRPIKDPDRIKEIPSPIANPSKPEFISEKIKKEINPSLFTTRLTENPIKPRVKEASRPQDIPVFSAPDDFTSIQAGEVARENKPKIPSISQQVEPVQKNVRVFSKRRFLQLGGASVVTLAVGEITKVAPVFESISDFFDWHPKTPEQAEAFMRQHSLSEIPVQLGEWSLMYPTLGDDEEFMDMFSNFRQQANNKNLISLYAPVGESNPYPLLVASTTILLDVYESKFTLPLVSITFDSFTSGRPFIVSGRKSPEDSRQRLYPNVIQIINTTTRSNFYLNVEPIIKQEGNMVEVRYMKRVKSSSLQSPDNSK